MRPSLAVVAAAATLFLLVGCQPAPTSPPSRVPVATGPTPACTPSPGAAATPCSADEFAAQQKQDALYVEAERVYREFFAEDEKLMRSGALPNAKLLELLAGPASTTYAESAKKSHDLRIVARGGVFKIVWLARAPGVKFGDSEVTLETCEDSTTVTGYQDDKKLGEGRVRRGYTFFKTVSGSLRIWSRQDRQGPSC